VKSITEQLHEVIDRLEEDINRDRFATLIFRIKDWKFKKYEKSYSKDNDEIGIEITD